jgi:hypothetical protein
MNAAESLLESLCKWWVDGARGNVKGDITAAENNIILMLVLILVQQLYMKRSQHGSVESSVKTISN